MRELNVGLDLLSNYESRLVGIDFQFKAVNQLVPEEVYRQVVQLHKNRPIPKEEKKQLLVFTENDHYRFTAKVKWYFNKQTEGEYGFLEKPGLPDLYFAGSSFLHDDPKNLIPGDLVVVTLAKQDVDEKKEDLKALAVNLLSAEKDLNFLLFYFLTHFRKLGTSEIEQLLQQIEVASHQLDETITASVATYVTESINYAELRENQYQAMYTLLKICQVALGTTSFWSKLPQATIFNYWINCADLELDFALFYDHLLLYTKSNLKSINNYFGRVDEGYKKKILDAVLLDTCSIEIDHDLNKITEVIGIYELYEVPLDVDQIPEAIHLLLWEQGKVRSIPIDAVFNKLIAFRNEYYSTPETDYERKNKYLQYFAMIDDTDLKNLLARTHYDHDLIDDSITFKTVLFFIQNLKNKDILADFTDLIYSKCSAYYKLLLFIEDVIELIDYDEVVIYTGLLSSQDQKLFFKKLLKLIAENKIVLTLDDLNKITTIDYQTSEYAKEIDGVGLDFTLSVILRVLTDLKEDIQTKHQTIFDLVANQIKSPKDLLVIDGFFEKCSGRTVLKESGKTEDEEGKSVINYLLEKKEHFLPRFATFCDGRKANNAHQKSGYTFWWCENSQCYDICRKKHSPQQWRDYTLEDALTILNIPYSETQYEILLNTVNRVNRFLAHLSCRECKSILKPVGKSNYAFYGVTLFQCKNTECSEDKEIYLSHCLNGSCPDIIDSRDTVRCKTEGYKEECGWYICKNCNACCSSEKLKARKSNIEFFGQEYTCHIEGHRDRGKICCSDCGVEMLEQKFDDVLYQKQLEWFIEQRNTHPYILNSGRRTRDNKWWFIWSRGNFTFEEYRDQLQRLLTSGFTIPDFDDKERDSHMIAEPFENERNQRIRVFICPACDHRFDINNLEEFDYGRKRAVMSFHNNIFSPNNN